MVEIYLLIVTKHIGNFGNGNVGGRVQRVDNILHPANLKPGNNKINHGPGGIGKTTPCVQAGHARSKALRQRGTNFIRVGGNDGGSLRTVNSFYDEVYGLQGSGIGHDRIEGKDPTMQNDAADDIQNHIIDHYKGANGESQPFCEYDRHYFNSVNSPAKSDGKATAKAGDQTAEDGAKEEICPSQRRRHGHIDGKHIGNKPSTQGVYPDRIQGVYRKGCALPFPAEKKQRDIECDQKYG